MQFEQFEDSGIEGLILGDDFYTNEQLIEVFCRLIRKFAEALDLIVGGSTSWTFWRL